MSWYDKKYFGNVEFPTEWKPDSEFYESVIDTIMSLSFGSISWYNYDEVAGEFSKSLTKDSFYYLWNTYPKMRDGLIEFCTKDLDSSGKKGEDHDLMMKRLSYRKDVLDYMFSNIPIDLEEESNQLRRLYSPHVTNGVNYLDEVNKARIAGKSDIYYLWKMAGRSSSRDIAFFDYCWRTVKREQGSVETKLALIGESIGNGLYSNLIINHCAKRGTKRMKRCIVSNLCYHHSEAGRKEKWEQPTEHGRSSSEIEEVMLLFANTDDSEVVDELVDHLSVDNLPWVMPSASKFSWLLRKLQRRIDSANRE